MKLSRAKKLARMAAGRYARRVWWAEVSDLEQQAWLALLRARQTFNPLVGVHEDAYVWRAMMLALSRYLWQQSTPATGGTKHRPKECGELLRAELDPPLRTRSPLIDPGPLPDAGEETRDEAAEGEAWAHAVRARLDALDAGRGGVEPLLTGRMTAAASALRAAASLDPHLASLAKERFS